MNYSLANSAIYGDCRMKVHRDCTKADYYYVMEETIVGICKGCLSVYKDRFSSSQFISEDTVISMRIINE
jgi:hypothetical protein